MKNVILSVLLLSFSAFAVQPGVDYRAVGDNLAPTFNPDYVPGLTPPYSNIFATCRLTEHGLVVGTVSSTSFGDGSANHVFKAKDGTLTLHFPGHTGMGFVQPLGQPDMMSGTTPEQAFPEIASYLNLPGPYGTGYVVLFAESNNTKDQIISMGGSWSGTGRLKNITSIEVRCAYLATIDTHGVPHVIKCLGCNYYLK